LTDMTVKSSFEYVTFGYSGASSCSRVRFANGLSSLLEQTLLALKTTVRIH